MIEEMEKLGYVQEKRSFWLGLTDKLHEGSFVLESTGEAQSFQNWERNEPNNYGDNEDCVQFMANNGKWNDNLCSRGLGTICEACDGGKVII